MKMCNENWLIRVDWPLKNVNSGTKKMKTQSNISTKLALFLFLTAKRRF